MKFEKCCNGIGAPIGNVKAQLSKGVPPIGVGCAGADGAVLAEGDPPDDAGLLLPKCSGFPVLFVPFGCEEKKSLARWAPGDMCGLGGELLDVFAFMAWPVFAFVLSGRDAKKSLNRWAPGVMCGAP